MREAASQPRNGCGKRALRAMYAGRARSQSTPRTLRRRHPWASESPEVTRLFPLSPTASSPLSTLPPVHAQVRSFFTLCWRHSPALFDEIGLLRDVHGPLRARILRHVGAQIRPQLPMLQARAPTLRCSTAVRSGSGQAVLV